MFAKNLILAAVVVFTSVVASAESRGLTERLDGFGYIPLNDTIQLESPVLGPDGIPVMDIQLYTPPQRGLDEREMILDAKRSVVKIDAQKLQELDEGLKNAIIEVVNNKSKTLKERGIEYPRKGIENFHVFGNFRAAQEINQPAEWFIAILPKNKTENDRTFSIDEVIFQVEWFGTGAGAHTQVRMVTNYPIVAIKQSDDVYSPYVFSNYNNQGDFTFTLQAVRTRGGAKDWAPMKGVTGEFANALQFFDTRTLALDQIKRSVVKEYQLNGLSSKQREDIFLEALNLADEQGESGIYNTVFASCVTYAMKALKGGIEDINTSWFNPYSIVEKVATAHRKGVDYTGTTNEAFGPLIDSEVMSFEKIRTSPETKNTFQLIQRLRRGVLETNEFDDIIRQIAYIINAEKVTYDQIQPILDKVVESKVKVADTAKSDSMRELLSTIEARWKEAFPNQSIDNFFEALQSLQTQVSE